MNHSEERHRRVEQIFAHALQLDSLEEQAGFLQRECRGDDVLRREIEQLIDTVKNPDSFLERAVVGDLAATDSMTGRDSELIGETIGNYKLLQKLGEGGMGTVYMAEQLRPVKRRVAIKVVKQGMDNRQFTARFEAERQALAMMDHPNIARVLDAGCTENGRPYFVMELVKGIPITQFCDENKLTMRQRLELFLPVCQAVQHAHQKGIIHRDLKPSNVLVAMYDDHPVPKVIDFGVAKATNQQLTDKTLFTMVGQIVGTWEYMSPEQAVLNQLDVDTRSDVYSLGVILYELLTGVTPIDGQRLRTAALEETLRLIREEEPPKPSTRVSSPGPSATATAGYRRTEPGVLAKGLRGDLDWIVMKALEKDRVRRYETASGLAADIQRHLADEAVEARAPSATYRLRKYARRNRGLVISMASIAVVLIASFFLMFVAWRRENVLRNIALAKSEEVARTLAFVIDYTMLLAMSGNENDEQRAIEIAQLINTPDSERWAMMLRAHSALHRGEADESIRYLTDAIDQYPNDISCRALLAWTYIMTGDFEKAALHIAELRTATPQTAQEHTFMALAYIIEPEKCLEHAEKSLALRESVVARLTRAHAIIFRSLDTGDRDLLQQAISDIDEADRRVSNNPYIQMVSLFAQTANIGFAETNGEPADALHRRARDLVEQLSAFSDFNVGRAMSAMYFTQYGSDDEMESAWENVLRSDSRGNRYMAVGNFLTQEKSRRALSWLQGDDYHSKYARTILRLIEPNGVEDAIDWYRELRKENKPVDFWLTVDFELPLFIGDASFIQSDAKATLKAVAEGRSTVRADLDHHVLRFLAGETTESELLSVVKGSNGQTVHAHYLIGLVRVAQGKRREAERHFEDAVRLGVFHQGSHIWSKAYLRHMRADPAWPNWIDSDPSTTKDKQ